jgi:hypothetical protein
LRPEECPFESRDLAAAYHEAGSTTRLAERCGVVHSTVISWMERRGIPRKPRGGANNPNGRRKNEEAMTACSRCGAKKAADRFRLCERCRDRAAQNNRRWERKKRGEGDDDKPHRRQGAYQGGPKDCKCRERYDYGDGVWVCKDCGRRHNSP